MEPELTVPQSGSDTLTGSPVLPPMILHRPPGQL